jgi:hypothetical protein
MGREGGGGERQERVRAGAESCMADADSEMQTVRANQP